MVALVIGLASTGVVLGGIAPAAADQAITSAGPLIDIGISSDLNCSVNHAGDDSGEFFSNTACATELSVAGTTYGPASIPSGNSPGGFTPVSQSGVTGSGTNASPFKIVTVVDVATTGLRITETDSYVIGQESYRTDVQIANPTEGSIAATLYRGGDCFLQNSDRGFGAIGNPPGAVACVAPDSENPNIPGTRIEQWLPITSGSHFYESTFSNVWNAMSSGNAFPDTCDCAVNEDNGAGLSWGVSVPSAGSVTLSHLTTFSPLGSVPLSVSKTADQATVNAGAQDGYTITVSNPNASSVALSTITDTLPVGFSYVAGSTTGATTANPSISGRALTWNGPLTVPGESDGVSGTLSLHFGVTVSTTPGTYLNNAGATSSDFTIAPTGDTAPITVQAVTTSNLVTSITGTPDTVTAGKNVQYVVTTRNDGPTTLSAVRIVDTLPLGAKLVSATPSSGVCTGTKIVRCDVGPLAPTASKTATLLVRTPVTVPEGGVITNSATARPGTNNTATHDTNVAAATPGSASGFVPAGGSISTGGPNPATLTLPPPGPGSADGAFVEMSQTNGGPFCAGPCLGTVTAINDVQGYTNPNLPLKLTISYRYTNALKALIDYLKTDSYKAGEVGPGAKIPNCADDPAWTPEQKRAARFRRLIRLGTHSGIANPSPCEDARTITLRPNGAFRLTYTILWLTGDPHFARR